MIGEGYVNVNVNVNIYNALRFRKEQMREYIGSLGTEAVEMGLKLNSE